MEQPPAPMTPEPLLQPEEIPPEMPPEEPEVPPEEDSYEEDLVSAEDREMIARETENRLQESFKESVEWWDKWNDELEELMMK